MENKSGNKHSKKEKYLIRGATAKHDMQMRSRLQLDTVEEHLDQCTLWTGLPNWAELHSKRDLCQQQRSARYTGILDRLSDFPASTPCSPRPNALIICLSPWSSTSALSQNADE